MARDYRSSNVDVVAASDIFSLSQLCSYRWNHKEGLQMELTLISGHLYILHNTPRVQNVFVVLRTLVEDNWIL